MNKALIEEIRNLATILQEARTRKKEKPSDECIERLECLRKKKGGNKWTKDNKNHGSITQD